MSSITFNRFFGTDETPPAPTGPDTLRVFLRRIPQYDYDSFGYDPNGPEENQIVGIDSQGNIFTLGGGGNGAAELEYWQEDTVVLGGNEDRFQTWSAAFPNVASGDSVLPVLQAGEGVALYVGGENTPVGTNTEPPAPSGSIIYESFENWFSTPGERSVVVGGEGNIAIGDDAGTFSAVAANRELTESEVNEIGTRLQSLSERSSVVLGGYAGNVEVDEVSGEGIYVDAGNASVVLGGAFNRSSGQFSLAGGGYNNTASGYAAVALGAANRASGCFSTASGYLNETSGFGSIVAGGSGNIASGEFSGILGGANNDTNECTNAFIVGSGILATCSNTTHVNNLLIDSASGCNGCVAGFNAEGFIVPVSPGSVPAADFVVQFTAEDLEYAGTTQISPSTRYFNVVGEDFTGSFEIELPEPVLGSVVTVNGFFFEYAGASPEQDVLIVPPSGSEIVYGLSNLPDPYLPGLPLFSGTVWTFASDGSNWFLVDTNVEQD